uniref:Uncharacterized protein n=1 Tax=Arundo donax TaxID=35708 RepID=A0A0A9AYD9_ARUDO
MRSPLPLAICLRFLDASILDLCLC